MEKGFNEHHILMMTGVIDASPQHLGSIGHEHCVPLVPDHQVPVVKGFDMSYKDIF